MKKYENFRTILYIQSEQLSTLKKTNEYFIKKVESLELIITKILQSTMTKGEMKTIIKEELLPIKETLIGTGNNMMNKSLQTETNVAAYSTANICLSFEGKKPINDAINKIKKIKKVEEVIQSNELTSFGSVWSLVELRDGRIATGGEDGNISVSTYDLSEGTWKRDIHIEKAHDNWVNSLCALNGNKLVSCSGSGTTPIGDFSIKIWNIFDANIVPIKTLSQHRGTVYQVISLTNGRFASCSSDGIVNVWKDNNEYELLSSLKHNYQIRGVLQLRGKDVLVSCSYDAMLGLTFWDLNSYAQLRVLKGYGIDFPSHMIQLADGNIALSSNKKPYPIEIIDSSSYELKKTIQSKGDITCYSSLCLLNQYSFFYVFNGTLLQISSDDYSIMFKLSRGNFNAYSGGMILLEGRNYFAIQNNKRIMIGKISDK